MDQWLEEEGLRVAQNGEYGRFLAIFSGCFLPSNGVRKDSGQVKILSKYLKALLEALCTILNKVELQYQYCSVGWKNIVLYQWYTAV